jgi:MbtH protein
VSFDNEDTVFKAVVNEEEQYSIWPEYKEIPAGWRAVGPIGKKEECLAYIRRVLGLHQRSMDRHATAKFAEKQCGRW